MTNVVKHRSRMVSRCANFVHRPGIFVQLNTCRGRDPLAFFHQFMEKISEVVKFVLSREMWGMRQTRKRRPAVYGGTENKLRPMGRTGVLQGFGLQSTGDHQIGSFFHRRERSGSRLERTQPGGSVQLVLHVRVAMASSAHESCPTNHLTA